MAVPPVVLELLVPMRGRPECAAEPLREGRDVHESMPNLLVGVLVDFALEPVHEGLKVDQSTALPRLLL